MKKWLISGLGALGVMVVLLACGKGAEIDEDATSGGPHGFVPDDVTAPALTINTPVADQVFANGNTINISGSITDDYGLYRGYVKVTNDANGSSVFYQAYEIHGFLSYNFNLNTTAFATMASTLTVTVSFEDHGYNAVTKTVKIKVNP